MQYTNLTISNLKNLRKIMEKLAINKGIFFRQKILEIAIVMSVWCLLRNRAYAQRGVAFLDLVLAPKCHDRVRMQRQLFYYHDVSDVILLIHCCYQGTVILFFIKTNINLKKSFLTASYAMAVLGKWILYCRSFGRSN